MKHLAIIGLLLALVGTHANADLITFDPDDYEAGTNLTRAHDGVTALYLDWAHRDQGDLSGPRRLDAYAAPCEITSHSAPCPTGDLGFGVTWDGHTYSCLLDNPNAPCGGGSPRLLEFTFDQPTSFVSLLFSATVEWPGLWAFDAANNLLFGCVYDDCYSSIQHLPGHTSNYEIAFQSDERNISRVVAGGIAGYAYVDALTYSVPEPPTLALLAMGLLAIRGMRQRQKL